MKRYLTAKISAGAVRHNITCLRDRAGANVQLCAVVKDNCYGHGIDVLYPVLADMVDGFAVACPTEALDLRARGYCGFILCFLSAYLDDFEIQDQLVEQHITQTLMSRSALKAVIAAAKRVGKQALVHVKIDSGMGRLGVPARQAAGLLQEIESASGVQLTGAYTHFASADEADKTSAYQQLKTFLTLLPPNGNLTRHAANSAAVIDLPESCLDMVRPGLAVYGYAPSDELKQPLDLRPAMELTGRLVAVKHMPKGSKSGYGLTYTYTRDSIVGVVPIGYGDGYYRSLSNRSVVRINGYHAPVRGRVSMDQITIDLTDVPNAQIGDEVEIISTDPQAPNCVENLARLADTIPYEITCRLGHHINHILVD